jgi:hypothetical protein
MPLLLKRQYRGVIGRDVDSLDDLYHCLARQCICHPVDSSRGNVVAGQQNRMFNAMVSGDWSENDSYVEWNQNGTFETLSVGITKIINNETAITLLKTSVPTWTTFPSPLTVAFRRMVDRPWRTRIVPGIVVMSTGRERRNSSKEPADVTSPGQKDGTMEDCIAAIIPQGNYASFSKTIFSFNGLNS